MQVNLSNNLTSNKPAYLLSKPNSTVEYSSQSNQVSIELTNQPLSQLISTDNSKSSFSANHHSSNLPVSRQPSAMTEVALQTNGTTKSELIPVTNSNSLATFTTPTNHHTNSTMPAATIDSRMLRHRCIFVQRDYSRGMGVRFETTFPPELRDRVTESDFLYFINNLNQMFDKAETLTTRSFLYNLLSCLTAYLFLSCTTDQYEQFMIKIRRFVDQQNASIFNPKGLTVNDPTERGLRVLEIQIDSN